MQLAAPPIPGWKRAPRFADSSTTHSSGPPPLALQLPTGARQPLPYLLTLVPPLLLAFSLGPAVFLDALDFAGTYGE